MKNDKNLQNIKKLAFGALFAALIFCGTYFIKLPMPFSEGYIHAGDGFVFLAAALLPAPYAMGAAAIGAGLSDLIGGYPLWIPATVGVRVLAVLLFSHRGEVFCARNFAALGGAAAINVAAIGHMRAPWYITILFRHCRRYRSTLHSRSSAR